MSRRRRRLSPGTALAATVAGLFVGNQYKKRAQEQALTVEEKQLRLLAIRDIQRLDAGEFEEYISLIFQKMGYQTILRGHTNARDQGIDIEAHRLDEYVVIQCKRHSSAIGSEVVRDFFGATVAEGADKGILVTTSAFSQPAREWARGKHIELAGPKEIIEWMDDLKFGPYNDSIHPKSKILPFPVGGKEAHVSPVVAPKNHIFTFWQWMVLLILSGMACVVTCGVCAALSQITPPH